MENYLLVIIIVLIVAMFLYMRPGMGMGRGYNRTFIVDDAYRPYYYGFGNHPHYRRRYW
jgi:hypothetical protein